MKVVGITNNLRLFLGVPCVQRSWTTPVGGKSDTGVDSMKSNFQLFNYFKSHSIQGLTDIQRAARFFMILSAKPAIRTGLFVYPAPVGD